MSVVFQLFKPRYEVRYGGEWWMTIRPSHLSDDTTFNYARCLAGGPPEPTGFDPTGSKFKNFLAENDKWLEEMYAKSFSDGKHHELFVLEEYTASLKHCREKHRTLKKIISLPWKSFHNDYYEFRYIVVDQVVYRQGWFLRKRFFNKKQWAVLCTSKKEIENFFKMYGDKSDAAEEARNAFLNAFEDGMIFECSF